MFSNEIPLVMLTDIYREFAIGDSTIQALRGITMEVLKGEFIVVLGPSGSGKTTLLNQIGGIDSPTKGSVKINGEELTGWKASELSEYRRYKVGWIFQFFNLIPSLRTWENVALALEFKGDRNDIKRRSCQMLEAVGLDDKINRFPSQLSGGEQQRVAIARALVKNPEIVVADEPTGNLDYLTGQKIANLMKELNLRFNNTFIIVSHDLSITTKADRVFHLRDGRIESIEDHPVLIQTKKVETD